MATKRELILMRHGKSDWSKPLSDYKRPIKKRGYREAESIGRWLKEQGLLPDLIISSPAVRARETAQTVADQNRPEFKRYFAPITGLVPA